MAVKTKVVSKAKPKEKVAAKKAVKENAAPKKVAAKLEVKAKPEVKSAKPAAASKPAASIIKRTVSMVERRRPIKKAAHRSAQFNFMKAPGAEHEFQVGDVVEVFCDHEKNRDRIRGWVKGIVVQVDHKLAAVQFRSNVYLTDGWMVPDRILWFPLNSEHIRPVTTGKKPADKKEFVVPDY